MFFFLVSRMTGFTLRYGPNSFFKPFDMPSLMPNVLENVKDTQLKLMMQQTVRCHLKLWCTAWQNQVQYFQEVNGEMYSESQKRAKLEHLCLFLCSSKITKIQIKQFIYKKYKYLCEFKATSSSTDGVFYPLKENAT